MFWACCTVCCEPWPPVKPSSTAADDLLDDTDVGVREGAGCWVGVGVREFGGGVGVGVGVGTFWRLACCPTMAAAICWAARHIHTQGLSEYTSDVFTLRANIMMYPHTRYEWCIHTECEHSDVSTHKIWVNIPAMYPQWTREHSDVPHMRYEWIYQWCIHTETEWT